MYTMSEVLPTHIYGVEIRVVGGGGGGGRLGLGRGGWGGGGAGGVIFLSSSPPFFCLALSPSLLTWGLFICSVFSSSFPLSFSPLLSCRPVNNYV